MQLVLRQLRGASRSPAIDCSVSARRQRQRRRPPAERAKSPARLVTRVRCALRPAIVVPPHAALDEAAGGRHARSTLFHRVPALASLRWQGAAAPQQLASSPGGGDHAAGRRPRPRADRGLAPASRRPAAHRARAAGVAAGRAARRGGLCAAAPRGGQHGQAVQAHQARHSLPAGVPAGAGSRGWRSRRQRPGRRAAAQPPPGRRRCSIGGGSSCSRRISRGSSSRRISRGSSSIGSIDSIGISSSAARNAGGSISSSPNSISSGSRPGAAADHVAGAHAGHRQQPARLPRRAAGRAGGARGAVLRLRLPCRLLPSRTPAVPTRGELPSRLHKQAPGSTLGCPQLRGGAGWPLQVVAVSRRFSDQVRRAGLLRCALRASGLAGAASGPGRDGPRAAAAAAAAAPPGAQQVEGRAAAGAGRQGRQAGQQAAGPAAGQAGRRGGGSSSQGGGQRQRQRRGRGGGGGGRRAGRCALWLPRGCREAAPGSPLAAPPRHPPPGHKLPF